MRQGNLDRMRFIAVEGPIGSGKTTLARRIAATLGADTLLERPEENPFLVRFYKDMERFALPTQLFFLFQRARQLHPIAQGDLFEKTVVSDFLLEKDLLFARLTVSNDELSLYERIYESLRPQAPAPDLVICLHAPTRTLLERVKKRGIGHESRISEEYVARLAEGYTRFFHHYTVAPLLTVHSDTLNFVDKDEDVTLLLEKARAMKSRHEFFRVG
jgi:deoxyguanosine kinase